MSPIRLVAIAVCLALASAPATAEERPARWRLASVPLDLPMDGGLDDQALEGLYQGAYGTSFPSNFGGALGGRVKDSVLVQSPFWHIETKLEGERRLQLWFSSAEDGRKVFGVRLSAPSAKARGGEASAVLAELEAAYGKPDLALESPMGKAKQQILIFVDREMPQERREAVRARLPKPQDVASGDVGSFWQADLRDWARLLGPDFRGAAVVLMVTHTQVGDLEGEVTRIPGGKIDLFTSVGGRTP